MKINDDSHTPVIIDSHIEEIKLQIVRSAIGTARPLGSQGHHHHRGVRRLESDGLVWLDNADRHHQSYGNVSHQRTGDDAYAPASTATNANRCV